MTTTSLRTLQRSVASAETLLGVAASPARLERVVIDETLRVLNAIDGLLAQLVVDSAVHPATAARLGRVRDDLAGHVLAAGAMTDIQLSPAKVVDVLRRGTAAAKVSVSELDEDLFRTPPGSSRRF